MGHSWEYMRKAMVKRRRQIFGWVVFGLATLAALLIIFQVAWPYDRFLPFQKIDGFDVGLKTYTEASEQLRQAYREQGVNFTSNNRVIGSSTIDEIGVEVSVDEQIEKAKFSLRDRFIPGSVLVKMFGTVAALPETSLDTARTASFLERNYATICTVSPINATISIDGERLRLTPDETGLLCDENRFLGNIIADNLTLMQPLEVKMDGKRLDALVTTADLQEIYDTTRNQLTNGIVFVIDAEKTLSARYLDLIKWLNIETDVFGHVKISYSDDKIREYLTNTVSAFVKQTNGVTVVTELNGVETGRKVGTTGRDLDYDKMIEAIKNYLDTNTERDKKLAVATIKTDPVVKYKRTFSKNLAGLLALFGNRLTDTPHTVAITDLAGRGMTKSVGLDKEFTSRLAGRLMMAYIMLDEVKAGRVTQSCFYKVVQDYDETCTKDFLKDNDVNKLLSVNGFHNTKINTENLSITTNATDLTNLLLAIRNGATSKDQQLGEELKKLIEANTLQLNTDADDLLMAATVVSGTNGSYVIVAVNGGDRDNLKETLGSIEEIFKPE
jgi:hypothetical protein